MTWLINRLREPSTWRGLIWLATAAGVSLAPDAWEYISTIGIALAGLLGIVLADEPNTAAIWEREPPVGDDAAGPERLRGALPASPDPRARRVGSPSSGFNG